MSALTADRIRDHATRLGLTHLTDTITELVQRAETAQMGYLDFVDLLLEEEVGLREGRRFRNALKLSGLPHHKTLEEFDFASVAGRGCCWLVAATGAESSPSVLPSAPRGAASSANCLRKPRCLVRPAESLVPRQDGQCSVGCWPSVQSGSRA